MMKVKSMIDIARLAGVSESTVSRALKDSPLISEKTKQKIQKIAKQHQFSVNRNAQVLSTKRTNTIAVVVNFGDARENISNHLFMSQMQSLLADELAKNNMEMLLSPDRVIIGCWHQHFIESKRADGIIILGPGSDKLLFDELTQHETPFVVWGGKESYQSHCVVESDNRQGSILAVEHLMNTSKCKNILLLGPTQNIEGKKRYQGYCDVIKGNGGKINHKLIVECDWTIDAGFAVTSKLLQDNDVSFDGIFALNDAIAMGAIRALQTRGINVPNDVAVVGYDNLPISELVSPALTSIRQNTVQGVKKLVENILLLIDSKAAQSIVLETELIARESSAVMATRLL